MSGAFLSPTPPSARERAAAQAEADYYDAIAAKCYRWATGLLVVAMIVIAMPQLGLAAWTWYIVGAVAVLMLVLAIQMLRYGRVSNGIACIICALAVLPGWVFISADVVAVGKEFYEMIAKQWKDKF